jgi:hypothetical protein
MSQCVDPGASIEFINNGQTTGTYTTQYVLTNGSNIIQQTVSNPFTAPVAEGNYKLYAVNYKSGETDPLIVAGANINAIGGSCVSISTSPLVFSVCVCVNTGSALPFAASGNNANTGYTTKFVVADAYGKLMSSSLSSPVTAPSGSGEYKIYSVNYKTGETDPDLSTGINISSLGGSCVTVSESPATFKICSIYDYGNLPVTGTVSWPLAYSSIACAMDGSAPLVYHPVTNPFYAVFGGTALSTENETPASGFDGGNDGLILPATVAGGNGSYDYHVTVNANGNGHTVYYRLWFDWNNNGNFADDVDDNSSPATYSGSAITAGPIDITVPVLPPSYASADYKVRLAISGSPISDVYRNIDPATVLFVANGEIEDYNGSALTLPVALIAFKGTKQQNNALLKWTTADEDNARMFVIERSINAQQGWEAIGSVKAVGTNAGFHQYSFTDTKVKAGMNYYRLRMVDEDGKAAYSQVELVEFYELPQFAAYPNPVKHMMNVTLGINDKQSYVLLRDITSRELMRVKTDGQTNIRVNMQSLLPGIYIIEVISHNQVVFKKKIVKN